MPTPIDLDKIPTSYSKTSNRFYDAMLKYADPNHDGMITISEKPVVREILAGYESKTDDDYLLDKAEAIFTLETVHEQALENLEAAQQRPNASEDEITYYSNFAVGVGTHINDIKKMWYSSLADQD